MSTRLRARHADHDRSLRILTLCGILLVSLVAAADALTITWVNSSGGNWSDPANWSPAQVPSAAGETAVLPSLSGPYQVTLDINPAVSAIQIAGGGPTLDLGGHSIAAVSSVTNAGHVTNYRGVFDGGKFYNAAGGILEVADGDSMIVTTESITNDGTIVIGASSVTALRITKANTVIDGSGTLQLGSGARITSPQGFPEGPSQYQLENGGGHTLVGSGAVWVAIVNSGLLKVDELGGLLWVKGRFTNTGTIRVGHGAGVHVAWPGVANYGQIIGSNGFFSTNVNFGVSGTIDNRGGKLVSEDGDLTVTSGVLWEGTVERTSGSGAVKIDIATPQNLVVSPGAELWAEGQIDLMADGSSLVNNGTIRVPGRINFSGAGGSVSLSGNGVLILDGGILDTPGATGTMYNQSGHTITGCGIIDARLVNYGTVDLNCGSSHLRTNDKINYGLIRASHGTLSLSGSTMHLINKPGGRIAADGARLSLEQGATLDLGGGTLTATRSTVLLGASRSACTLIGGRLESADGGSFLNYGTATLQDMTIGASAKLTTWDRATTVAAGSRLENRGTNQINAGGRLTLGAGTEYLQTGGATVLAGGSLSATREVRLQGGALRGVGTITGDVANAAEIDPGSDTGALSIQGNYRQLAGGRLALDLGGTGVDQFDRLNVSGSIALDGQLAVATVNDYQPGVASNFAVISGGSLSGRFVDCDGTAGASKLDVLPQYGSAGVSLLVNPGVLAADGNTPASLRFFGTRDARGVAFALELPQAADVSVRAFDVSGREVGLLADGQRAAGRYTLRLSGSGGAHPLAGGVYFARAAVRMAGRTEVRTARVVFFE